ncbi:MAG TPA: hypothetical protein VEI53_08270, partial [Ktedonobacteraceae bacterium]|nr:hypothetical protein [Ktedonobacteraceae bacterium]
MMKKGMFSPRRHLFVFISLLLFFTLLLAACGSPTTSGGTSSPIPGKTTTPVLQTSCPPEGTARAAVMVPLILGKQNTVVYSQTLVLKRYTVSTRKTDVIMLGNGAIVGARISADGQWVLMQTTISDRSAIQLVRMDGQGLQTLYCAPGGGFGWMQWSPDNKYVAFIDTPGDQSTWTFKLLNITTGAIQTTGYDSKNLLYFPLEWLDITHLYVSSFSPGAVPSNLYLLNAVTGEKQLILKAPPHGFDASISVDGTQLYTLQWTGSAGPSSIQVQPATGGPAKTVYSTSTYAINAMKVASRNTLVFLINNTNADTSHNGVWKINTDGTGLTKLISNSAILSGRANKEIGFVTTFNWGMDAYWANASRDGTHYSLEVFDRSGGPNNLIVGS